MPWRSKQLCAGRCGRTVSAGYCESCRASGVAEEEKPEWHALYGAAWQRASKTWLAQHPLAVDIFGGHRGVLKVAEAVDHIIPHRGDRALFWDSSNWQGLTKSDHDRKTALERLGWKMADGRMRPPAKTG
jgi:5-methylcytosine-specific restriction enzyme A